MIIFINGAFGVGKTTVAERLVGRLPGALLFDAEDVGYFLRKLVAPIDQPDDFQDLALWRSLTVITAGLLRHTYGRTLVMPMTIWRQAYLEDVLSGLRANDADVFHFTLTATAQTLEARIRRRGDSVAWCLAHLDGCISAFHSSAFAVQIATDGKTPEQVVADILALLPATVPYA